MFKHYFEGIEGISVYPIVSLIIFLGFFIGITLLAIMVSKRHCANMSNLPLEGDQSFGQPENLISHE